MNILSKKQTQALSGGSMYNAAGSAVFSLVGTAIGFVTGPHFMPLVLVASNSYSAQMTDYIIDMKAGEYGIHSKSDAIGAAAGSLVGCFLGGVSWGAIN